MTKGDEVSKFARSLDSEVLQRWAATAASIGFQMLVLPSRVNQAVEHRTGCFSRGRWCPDDVPAINFAAESLSLAREDARQVLRQGLSNYGAERLRPYVKGAADPVVSD